MNQDKNYMLIIKNIVRNDGKFFNEFNKKMYSNKCFFISIYDGLLMHKKNENNGNISFDDIDNIYLKIMAFINISHLDNDKMFDTFSSNIEQQNDKTSEKMNDISFIFNININIIYSYYILNNQYFVPENCILSFGDKRKKKIFIINHGNHFEFVKEIEYYTICDQKINFSIFKEWLKEEEKTKIKKEKKNKSKYY